MQGNTEVQTGDVFENDYMTIVVTGVSENKVTYSAGSVETTHTVLKSKFDLKVMTEDFEKVGTQNVSENAEVVNPDPADETDTHSRSQSGGTRQMMGTQFYDRSTETALEGKGPLSW